MSTKSNDNKEIEVRGCLTKPKKSKFYHAVLTFFDENGVRIDKQQVSTKQTVKTDALRVMLEMVDRAKQVYLCLSSHTPFVDFMKHWLENIIINEVEETTYNGYRLNVENHIIPYFKPLKLRLMDITSKVIQKFLDDKCEKKLKKTGKPLKSNSVKRFHANLKVALDYAVQQECIEYNTARPCKVKREKNPFIALYYTFEQLIELCKACVDSPIAHAIMLAVFYGLRRGEILGLKWKHVDFSTNTIRICETITRAKKEIKKGTKNVSSDRVMPMILGFSDYLKSLKQKQQETARFFGKKWTDEQYVVSDEAGERFKMGYLNNCFKRLIEATGLHDIRLHDLRHSCATFLLEYSPSPRTVVRPTGPMKGIFWTSAYQSSFSSLEFICLCEQMQYGLLEMPEAEDIIEVFLLKSLRQLRKAKDPKVVRMAMQRWAELIFMAGMSEAGLDDYRSLTEWNATQ